MAPLSPLFGSLATAMRANDELSVMMAEMAILGNTPPTSPTSNTFPVSALRFPTPHVRFDDTLEQQQQQQDCPAPHSAPPSTSEKPRRKLSRRSLLERRRNVQSITHDYLEIYTDENTLDVPQGTWEQGKEADS